MSLEVGSIVEGTVTGITNFGVFIQLPGGEIGLVHISEIADTYVKNINDYLQKRDKVKVKILCIDQGGKIGLSIKQANKTQKQNEYKPNEHKRKGSPSKKLNFEDKLVKFFKESDERQQDLKKNTEAKRGGRGSFRQEV
ncbi:MAG: RNA-binding protein S1 [Firmicutes bacterium HGW-Firmicutes-13]|nr:MAG: RNA-binding protein S1 [Firmicutes bacterium HGW-Firmicutes-13]